MDARTQMIIVGYAKVPANSTSHATHELFSISLLVEPPRPTVLAVESTAATSMAQEWLASLLVGADLTADDSPYLAIVDQHYLGPAAGTIKQAIRDAWRRYASAHERSTRAAGFDHPRTRRPAPSRSPTTARDQ